MISKALFIRFTLFILLLVLTYFLLSAGIRYENEDRKRIQEVLQNCDKVEVLVVGGSNAAAIKIDKSEYFGYNLFVNGRDFAEIYYTLNFLIPKLPKLKYVFITLNYFTLYRDNLSISQGLADSRVVMYYSTPSWTFIPGDFTNFLLGKFFPFIKENHWQSIIKSLLNFNDWRARKHQETNKNVLKPDSTKIYTKVYKYSVYEKGIAIRNNPQVKQYNFSLILNLVKKLNERNINCIFFSTPYYFLYSRFFNNYDKKELRYYLQKLSKEYKFCYLDFSMDPEYIYDPNLFQDEDHLTESASQTFSKTFFKSVKTQCLK